MSKVRGLVADAISRINELSVDEVQTLQAEQADFVLVDIRDESEWAVDHLPNALHLTRGKLEFLIEQTIPDVDTKIVLYCGGGSRSALSAESLQKMGYTNVYSMAGGYRDWKEHGYELV